MHEESKLHVGMEDLDLKGLVTSRMSFQKTNHRFVGSAERKSWEDDSKPGWTNLHIMVQVPKQCLHVARTDITFHFQVCARSMRYLCYVRTHNVVLRELFDFGSEKTGVPGY